MDKRNKELIVIFGLIAQGMIGCLNILFGSIAVIIGITSLNFIGALVGFILAVIGVIFVLKTFI